MKRLISLFIVVVMVVALLPVSALAAIDDGSFNANADYKINIRLAFLKSATDKNYSTTYYVDSSKSTAKTSSTGTTMWTGAPNTYSVSGFTCTNKGYTGSSGNFAWEMKKSSSFKVKDALPAALSTLGSGYTIAGYKYVTGSVSSFTATSITKATTWSAIQSGANSYSGYSGYSTVPTFVICLAPGSGTGGGITPTQPPVQEFVPVRIRHYDNSNKVLIDTDTVIQMPLNQAYSITATTTAAGFNTAENNYSFLKWEILAGTGTLGSAYAANTTFTAKGVDSLWKEIRLNCYWVVSPVSRPTHTLTINTIVDGILHGTNTTDVQETKSTNIAPDKSHFSAAYNYVFQGWTITGGSINNPALESAVFTMGTSDVTATATYTISNADTPMTPDPVDSEFSFRCYTLYLNEDYTLGYSLSDSWTVPFICQDKYCGASHTFSGAVLTQQMNATANTVAAKGYKYVGWTKTASANPTIYTNYTDDVLVTTNTGYCIYLVAQPDMNVETTKTVSVKFMLNGQLKGSANLQFTGKVWDKDATVTIDAQQALVQSGLSYEHALAEDTQNITVKFVDLEGEYSFNIVEKPAEITDFINFTVSRVGMLKTKVNDFFALKSYHPERVASELVFERSLTKESCLALYATATSTNAGGIIVFEPRYTDVTYIVRITDVNNKVYYYHYTVNAVSKPVIDEDLLNRGVIGLTDTIANNDIKQMICMQGTYTTSQQWQAGKSTATSAYADADTFTYVPKGLTEDTAYTVRITMNDNSVFFYPVVVKAVTPVVTVDGNKVIVDRSENSGAIDRIYMAVCDESDFASLTPSQAQQTIKSYVSSSGALYTPLSYYVSGATDGGEHTFHITEECYVAIVVVTVDNGTYLFGKYIEPRIEMIGFQITENNGQYFLTLTKAPAAALVRVRVAVGEHANTQTMKSAPGYKQWSSPTQGSTLDLKADFNADTTAWTLYYVNADGLNCMVHFDSFGVGTFEVPNGFADYDAHIN